VSVALAAAAHVAEWPGASLTANALHSTMNQPQVGRLGSTGPRSFRDCDRMEPLSQMRSAAHAVTTRQRAIVLSILQRGVNDAPSAHPENPTPISAPAQRRGPQYLAPLPERIRAHD
jgi:hypothetical protein